MKKIIFFFALFCCFSCAETPPKGQIWLLETTDGRFFEVTSVNNWGNDPIFFVLNGINLKIPQENIKSLALMKKDKTPTRTTYSEGYRNGQIDYYNNRICWIKMLNDKGEVVFTDTCK